MRRKGEKEDMEEGRRERKEIQRKVEGAREEGDEREKGRERKQAIEGERVRRKGEMRKRTKDKEQKQRRVWRKEGREKGGRWERKERSKQDVLSCLEGQRCSGPGCCGLRLLSTRLSPH